MRKSLALLALLGCTSADASILFNTTHAANAGCLGQLLPGSVDVTIFVDYVTPLQGTANTIIAAAGNAGGSYKSVASGATVNHQPYLNTSTSYTGTPQQFDDTSNYATALSIGVLENWAAVNNAAYSRQFPPVILTNVNNCANAGTSSGWGTEFCVPSSFTGLHSACLTDSPSNTTASFTQMLASVKQQNASLNWFDIKGAFRQTAGNWATGYDHTHFGYGQVNYASALALTSASSIFLQPPTISATNGGYSVQLQLTPYRQTRRTKEVIYSVSAAYVWPVKNEYTTADITASGATLLYTSNGTDTQPTFTYTPAASGTVTFVAFTTDGSGNYSRIEEFSSVAVPLIVGTNCWQ